MKDLFYGFLIVVICLGIFYYGADKYIQYEAKQTVMTALNDDGSKDIDYRMEKIGLLTWKCTGESKSRLGLNTKRTSVCGIEIPGENTFEYYEGKGFVEADF